MAHDSQRVPNSNKNTSKTHRTLIPRARVRKRAPAYIFMTKKMRSFPQTFFISKNTWENDRTLIEKSTLFHHYKFRCGLSFDEFADRI